MPCQDSSSSISIRLDREGRLTLFNFSKITCSRPIDDKTDYQNYCRRKTPEEILKISFAEVVLALQIPEDEERRFVLHLEWDALRSAIAQYLGTDIDGIDRERCKVSSVTYDDQGVEIVEVILPPKEMPKILPCSLLNNN